MSNRVLFALDGSERLEAVLPAVSAVAMGRDVSLELTSAMGRPPGALRYRPRFSHFTLG